MFVKSWQKNSLLVLATSEHRTAWLVELIARR
jgi:hypothetical protein